MAATLTLWTLRAAAFDPYPTDPLFANGPVSPTPAKNILGDPKAHPCTLTPLPSLVDLPTAAEHALCTNPKTRQAWANVKVQAAQLGGARAAYLPTLDGNLVVAHDHAVTTVPSETFFDSDNALHYRSETLTLTWLIYDFGARGAALDQARRLLDSALASQDAALQTVLLTVASDYYTASAAQAIVDSAAEVERAAEQSLLAASERVRGGVAPVTDKLQAQTAYAQAVYNHAKARGDLKIALGTLALDVGVPPTTDIHVATQVSAPAPGVDTTQAVASLLDAAQRDHPNLVAARAQLVAAEAKMAQARAQGLPSFKLNSHISHNTQPANPALGSPDVPAIGRDRYIGLEVDIPLFEGLSRTYQIRQAQAQVEVQRANVADEQQQVALDVWRSYQTLQTNAENLRNSEMLVDSARDSFDAARHRYDRGVGNILELLSAQTAYANARQQRVQALADWQIGKLKLASSVGRLALTDVDESALVR